MSLLSLPNEIIRHIALYFLEKWNNPEHSKARPIAPVSFDVNLRNVCSTNQRLRDVCRSLLYRNAWVSICGIRSMDSQQAHIARKLFSNKELCGLVRHARLRDNVRGNHDPINATAPDARHPPIRQIIQDLISALPNLISLDILGTFFALSSDILVAINAHSNLKTVTLEEAYQLHTLPSTSADSLRKICCRKFRLPPSAWQTMPEYFRPGGGARLDSLYLSRSTLEELGDCTLSGLRSIVLPAPTDLFPSPDAASVFVKRHSSLESITLRGASSLNLRSLSCLPCFSEMFMEAKERGLHNAFQCEEVELSRDPYNESAVTPAWSIVSATLWLTSQSSAGLPLFLKSLSSIRRLSIIKTSVEDDVFSVQDLFTILHTHATNLRHLTTLTLSNFPLKDDLSTFKQPSVASIKDISFDLTDDDITRDWVTSTENLNTVDGELGPVAGVRKLATQCKDLRKVIDYGPSGTSFGGLYFSYSVTRELDEELEVKWGLARFGFDKVVPSKP